MGYDEIETKTGNLFPTLNGQSEPLYFLAGIVVIGLIGIFFYGSYSGLGSSL